MPEATQQKASWWGRLQQAAARTREQLTERMDDVLLGKKEIDPQVFSDLEAVLLASDLGLDTTTEVLTRLRDRAQRKDLADVAALRAALREELASLLRSLSTQPQSPDGKPHVVFLVGVNGTGKTTTVAKLARRWQSDGRRVILCAADTFRAAASEQLEIWAERLGAELLRQKPGADPAAPPLGAKGLTDPAAIPTPAAIANAVFNALGRRMKDLPITRDKILGALA
ncbi:MAG: AAA family ATPase [Acidobacteria bacterium]|nr:AAA family ATPase [Acidobacteriota bacterium]